MTSPEQQIGILIDKALLSIKNGETHSAFISLEEALRYEVPVRGLQYVLALCHMQKGDFEKAQAALRAELLHFPDDADAKALQEFLKKEQATAADSVQPLPEKDVRKIVFVRADSIGDNVIALGTLPYIRTCFPSAELHVVCQQHIAEIYEACPLVHRVISFETQTAMYNQAYLNRLIAGIRDLGADVALTSVYSPSLLNHLLVLATNAPKKIALEGDYTNISREEEESVSSHYTQLIQTSKNCNELGHHRNFLIGLGVREPAVEAKIWLRPEDEEYAENIFRQNGFAGENTIALFSAGQQEFKASLVFGQAIAGLRGERDFTVIAVGGPEHHAINEQNCIISKARYINMSGKTSILQSAALLKHSRLAVGTDTGHAHIACAVGIPSVILLGGGHFGRFLPYSSLTSIVCLPLSCYGCNWYCRYPETYCVKDVQVDCFCEAIRQTLKNSSSKPRIFFRRSIARMPGYPDFADVRNFFVPGSVECISTDEISRK